MSAFDSSGREKLAYNASTIRVPKQNTWTGQLVLVAPGDDGFVACPEGGIIRGVIVTTEGGPGSCSIDVRKHAAPTYPGSGDSITGGHPIVISSDVYYSDTLLSGWTITITAGDILGFHLNSTSAFRIITVRLDVEQ